jgi:nicotinate-nucleotide pyrophosphorylase (carboxylating)
MVRDSCLPLAVDDNEIQSIIALALNEDHVLNDATSQSTVPEQLMALARLMAKAEGILAGVEVFAAVFHKINPDLLVEIIIHDGSKVVSGTLVASVSGKARSILAAERTALNFLCHLSGIATETARYVAQLKGLPVVITDTRKTMAGMRLLEKHAVSCGGGRNHRFNLADGILIKDNHIAALRRTGMTLKEIALQARRNAPMGLEIEVEVTSKAEALEAVAAGADMILLDNMPPEDMREVVAFLADKAKFEASGGINLQNVRAVALSGVNRISIGAITHSAKSLDFSLEMD